MPRIPLLTAEVSALVRVVGRAAAGPATTIALAAALLVGTAATRAAADTVVLKNGKKLAGVVVSKNDDREVVVNPWNSRLPGMTWQIPDKNRIPRDQVEEVIVEELDPRVEFRRRASAPRVTPDERVALAAMAEEHRWKDDREEQLLLALIDDPTHEGALEAYGRKKWETFAIRNKQIAPEVREAERAYLAIRDAAAAKQAAYELDKAGSKLERVYLERARRSAAIPRGLREKVPLTLNSEEAPGATYAIYVPESYDPLRPNGLVVALHGGGAGGKDETLVTGSGEQAMPFYLDVAREWGLIVVCPTAIVAPWNKPGNRPVIEGVLAEMHLLFNVDPRRVYLTGHSMGGFGTWYWSVHQEDTWAAVSPCAGGGGMAAVPKLEKAGTPIYVYHGADDAIVPPSSDRQCAELLRGDGKKGGLDFVYTELDGVGHGFPAEVRADLFRWMMGRWREGKRVGRSSFDAKVSKDEIEAFGDPSKIEADEDASLKELVAQLTRGGGAAAQAAEALGARKDKATIQALADVLRSRKSAADVRVQAAIALGRVGEEACIEALARCADDEDFRVVDAATAALGSIGGEATRAPLLAMTRALGRWFRDSFEGGAITHTEYDVRLASFVGLLEAIGKAGDAATFHDAIGKEIVGPVFPEGERYRVYGDDDDRFKNVSPAARRRLVRALGECLDALADPEKAALLRPIAERWSDDRALVAEVERALGA